MSLDNGFWILLYFIGPLDHKRWAFFRTISTLHLYQVTRIEVDKASPVSCSRVPLSALRPLNSRPCHHQMFSRWTFISYQYDSKQGYPSTHKKDQSLHLCIEPSNFGVNHFQPYPNRNETAKHWQAPLLFPKMQPAHALVLWRCFKGSAFTGLNWTRIYDLSWHDRETMRDWNSWTTSLQETAQEQASLSVSEILPDPVTLLLDRLESSPSETKPLPSQCGSLEKGLLKWHTGTRQS